MPVTLEEIYSTPRERWKESRENGRQTASQRIAWERVFDIVSSSL